MSAPPSDPLTSLSSSGYEDGLGRRTLIFDRVAGITVERLTLRPELSVMERALTERAARLTAFDDKRIARVVGVQRDPASGALTVDSEFVSGTRLSDLIEAAAESAEDAPVAGIDVAVGFLLDVLPALGALHTACGITHGALGPGRILLTPDGRVVLLDALFADALQRLQFTPARLWTEFGMALPAAAGPIRLDVVADLSQAGMAALMLALGRPLRREEFPARLPDALSEALEIAQIRGSADFANRFERFLRQILPLAERRPFSSAKDAFNELRDVADADMGVASCRTALASFVRDAGSVRAPVHTIAADDVVARPVAEVAPLRSFEPEPEIVPATTDPVTIVGSDPAPWAEANVEPASQPEPILEPWSEAAPLPAVALSAVPQPVAAADTEPSSAGIEEPITEAVAEVQVQPDPADVFEPIAIPEPVPVPEPAAAPEVDVPAAAVAAPSGRRKRNRGPRAKRDKLRSNAAPPAPLAAPEPPPALVPVIAPPVRAVAEPPRPVVPIRMPFAAPPAGAESNPSAYTADRIWEAAAPAPAQAAPPPMPRTAPVAVRAAAPPAAAPLRIKVQSPAGYDPPPAPRSGPRAQDDESIHSLPQVPRSGRRAPFPWKAAAAALVIIASGAAAGRGYFTDRDALAVTAAPKPAAAASPVEAPAVPAARATGTIKIESTPSGAKVLLDGAAAGETPLTLADVAPGRRVVTLVSAAGTVRRTVRVQAGKTIALDIPVYSGFVNVIAPIILEVAVGGRSIGTTEQGRLLLPPGRHELTLSNPDLDYVATHMVEIESGEEFRTTVEPRATVSINALPWAEVWIDGHRAGETPLAKTSMLLGTHEVVFKHPQFGERRQTVTIKASSPTTISADFTKPDRQDNW